MFVTSVTTAAAFLTNYFSNIVILRSFHFWSIHKMISFRCFGIFAAITILVNYIFVITALPAAIILLNRHRIFKDGVRVQLQNSVVSKLKDYGRIIVDGYIYKLPILVYRIHKFIILISFILIIASVYVVAVNPGIRLPENNALQVTILIVIRTNSNQIRFSSFEVIIHSSGSMRTRIDCSTSVLIDSINWMSLLSGEHNKLSK